MDTTEQKAATKAQELREQFGLGIAPISDIGQLFEAQGYDLAIIEVTDSNQHGMTAKDPKTGAIFTVVATTKNFMRQRSTIAHELSHIIFDNWHQTNNPFDERDDAEKLADSFARHLLLPQEALTHFAVQTADSDLNLAEFSRLVQTYLVSPQIAAIALSQAGYIDETTKNSLMNYTTFRLAQKYGWADKYENLQLVSSQTQAPQKLLGRAVAGYQQGIVTAQVIATLRGTTHQQILAELQEAGIHPYEDDYVAEIDDFDDLIGIDIDTIESSNEHAP